MMENCELCELCERTQGDIILSTEKWRIVLVDDANYPGFCRVIWQAHVKEMSDLSETDRLHFMHIVWEVEIIVREVMHAHKINLASFGNMVPHLHWHIIPRYEDDAHFPNPIWAQTLRESPEAILEQRRALLPLLRERLKAI
jgi:diadenosine tetraphosphate (Ap4A) HIT family hydrolase